MQVVQTFGASLSNPQQGVAAVPDGSIYGAAFQGIYHRTAAGQISAAVPIVVERAVYGNAGGVFWSSGGNALAVPLP